MFRDDLDAARDAVVEHRRLECALASGPARRHHEGRQSGHGDPTFSAVARAGDIGERLGALEEQISEVGEVLAGCRKVFPRLADAAELHWLGIDGAPLPWREVGRELGVSASTAAAWADTVIDWVDSVGPANARLGRGRAEE